MVNWRKLFIFLFSFIRFFILDYRGYLVLVIGERDVRFFYKSLVVLTRLNVGCK